MAPQIHRRALAGLGYLEGKSGARALIDAGYAPSTAATPKSKGLDAKACIQAAVEVFPEVNGTTIGEKTRRAVSRKLDRMLDSDEALEKVPMAQLSRLLDVTERHYSARANEEHAARMLRSRFDLVAQAAELSQSLSLQDVVDGPAIEADNEAKAGKQREKADGNVR